MRESDVNPDDPDGLLKALSDMPDDNPWAGMPEHMCGRCGAEVLTAADLYDSGCSEKPEKLMGMPLGQYHCPDCGAMVVAGCPHPTVCAMCRDRQHPGFDMHHEHPTTQTNPGA